MVTNDIDHCPNKSLVMRPNPATQWTKDVIIKKRTMTQSELIFLDVYNDLWLRGNGCNWYQTSRFGTIPNYARRVYLY